MAIHAPDHADSLPADIVPAPERQRSHGVLHLRVGLHGGQSRLADLHESGPARLRFPKARGGPVEAVQVNTAGGIACGDRFDCSVTLDAEAQAVFTTTAAEKIYRSDGPVSLVTNRLALERGARLAWLPQETILFDRARLRRRLEADLAAEASLLVCEVVVFGRLARGERIGEGLFEDHWRIRRAGRLVYADSTRLDGPVGDRLDRAAIGGGARALATILDCSAEAEARLDEARVHLDAACGAEVEAGASAWNGHLAVRLLGRDSGALRNAAARWLIAYRGVPLPRVWQS